MTTIVLCSYLEPELVDLIAREEDVEVIYRPDLIPAPRYKCDHTGPRRELTPEQLGEWRRLLATADVSFDFDWLEPERMPENCPRLKWIQGTSAGIGGLMERTGLNSSGITATTAGVIHAVPLAEFALMGALHFTKGLPTLKQWQAQHHWQRFTTRQLRGRSALVVGLGGMGRSIAATFARQGVEVWGMGRAGVAYDAEGVQRYVDRADLDDVLPDVDLLVLACPLTRETEGLIGASQVALLRSDAVVINLSRGQLIDQPALTDALANGRLAGACLDVFAVEPLPVDDPLWDLDNVIVSPHSASTVATENEALVNLFIENLGHLRRGERMRNLFDPVAGY